MIFVSYTSIAYIPFWGLKWDLGQRNLGIGHNGTRWEGYWELFRRFCLVEHVLLNENLITRSMDPMKWQDIIHKHLGFQNIQNQIGLLIRYSLPKTRKPMENAPLHPVFPIRPYTYTRLPGSGIFNHA